MTLYLIRHAMPDVRPEADPAAWSLGADGLAAARRIAARLPADAMLVASDEPKAWQTVDPDSARDVLRDPRLGEVRRVEAFSSDFRRARRSYVNGAVLDGWEPQAQVGERFAAAVAGALELAAGRDLVVASHGMAMTIWLDQVISLSDPAAFWDELRFPDVLVVDLRARSVTRPAAGWSHPATPSSLRRERR